MSEKQTCTAQKTEGELMVINKKHNLLVGVVLLQLLVLLAACKEQVL